MICYSVFGCCSTWWAEPGKLNLINYEQCVWISFPSVILGYILLIQRYPYKTCVFIGQEARYLDSGCSVIAWVIYGYLFCWTLLSFPSNVDELVRVISPLVFCASPWFFYVYVCTKIYILSLFSGTECIFPCLSIMTVYMIIKYL